MTEALYNQGVLFFFVAVVSGVGLVFEGIGRDFEGSLSLVGKMVLWVAISSLVLSFGSILLGIWIDALS